MDRVPSVFTSCISHCLPLGFTLGPQGLEPQASRNTFLYERLSLGICNMLAIRSTLSRIPSLEDVSPVLVRRCRWRNLSYLCALAFFYLPGVLRAYGSGSSLRRYDSLLRNDHMKSLSERLYGQSTIESCDTRTEHLSLDSTYSTDEPSEM